MIFFSKIQSKTSMTFSELLTNAVLQKGNSVSVGLDPRYDLIPVSLKKEKSRVCGTVEVTERFCIDIIDVVAPLVPVVKPQAAFFEQYGPGGLVALENIIRYARQKGLLVIFDGKRNDIGSTAEVYANAILGADSPWGADALTVSPYLGGDSLQPFIKTATERNAGIFVLVKTSNPGGTMIQDLVADGKPVYHYVAEYIQKTNVSQIQSVQDNHSVRYGNVGAVVGATWAEQLVELRRLMPNTWFLVPGFGFQGGSAKDVAPVFDKEGLGAVINNSRGIIFAYQEEPFKSKFSETNWQQAVEAATIQMIEQLHSFAKGGGACRNG
jgi:orotidine-5'-phosphate decarboxylase